MKKRINSMGNEEFLNLEKTLILSAAHIEGPPADRCEEFARQAVEEGKCIITGVFTVFEKKIYDILFAGNQPLIVALNISIPIRPKPPMKRELEKGRILIISPFEEWMAKGSSLTSRIRDEYVIEIADKVMVAEKDHKKRLDHILAKFPNTPFEFF